MTSLDLVDSTKEATFAHSNKSTFRSKNGSMGYQSMEENGNIFFKLFLGGLDEQMTSQATKINETKKKA